MKILVPVDGSPTSKFALEKSIEIAEKYGFSIQILSVINNNNTVRYKRNENLWHLVDGSMISNVVDEENDAVIKMKENAKATLDNLLLTINTSGVKISINITVGEPYEKILETANEDHFDLVVMTNKGDSMIKDFFLGTIAQRVIAGAKCPVLTFPYPG